MSEQTKYYEVVPVNHKNGKGYPKENGNYHTILQNGVISENRFYINSGFRPNGVYESEVSAYLRPISPEEQNKERDDLIR